MLDRAWRGRFAFLPIGLALTTFAIGSAGFIATAGVPSYSQPVAALPEIVFSAPSVRSYALAAPPAFVSADAPVVTIVLLQEPEAVPSSSSPVAVAAPVAAPAAAVVAASESAPSTVLLAAPVEPAAAPDPRAQVASVAVVSAPSATPAAPAPTVTERKVVTLATPAAAPVAATTPSVPRGNEGREKTQPPATAHVKVEGAGRADH